MSDVGDDREREPQRASTGSAVVIISPHLDDAVMSCGQLIGQTENCIVVTVFAGEPDPDVALTRWDRDSGFHSGENPVATRKDEDRAALAVLGARAVWLNFQDEQYRGHELSRVGGVPHIGEMAADIAAELEMLAPNSVFFPLGLRHPDHRMTTEAALRVLGLHPEWDWFSYEDAIYRTGRGDPSGDALAHLVERGLSPTAVDLVSERSTALKRVAFDCYTTQIRALMRSRANLRDVFRQERYWLMSGGEREHG